MEGGEERGGWGGGRGEGRGECGGGEGERRGEEGGRGHHHTIPARRLLRRMPAGSVPGRFRSWRR